MCPQELNVDLAPGWTVLKEGGLCALGFLHGERVWVNSYYQRIVEFSIQLL